MVVVDLREAAKQLIYLVVGPLRGGGMKAGKDGSHIFMI